MALSASTHTICLKCHALPYQSAILWCLCTIAWCIQQCWTTMMRTTFWHCHSLGWTLQNGLLFNGTDAQKNYQQEDICSLSESQFFICGTSSKYLFCWWLTYVHGMYISTKFFILSVFYIYSVHTYNVSPQGAHPMDTWRLHQTNQGY